MSKRLGGIKRLQIQNLFMAFKRVPYYDKISTTQEAHIDLFEQSSSPPERNIK